MRGLSYRELAVAFCAAVLCGFAGSANAQDKLKVVTTIKPVHSIAASVMAGVAEPELLLQGAASPHSYSLKPSDARQLSEADVIIRVSDGLEVFLEKALKTLPENARLVTLEEAPGLTLLPVREGGDFEAHEHDDGHKHAKEESGHGHKHSKKKGDHDHDHGDKHAKKTGDHDDEHKHKHGEEDDHAHEGHDVHFWLDPQNGMKLADYIASQLSEAAPQHAATFRANADKLKATLAALDAELQAKLEPVKDKPFIVFHDIVQYLGNRYGLNTAGAITVSPERQPGAKRVRAVREKIEKLGAVCVFAEPQFPPKLVTMLVDKTKARTGTLDEIGVEIPAGPEHYTAFLRQNADNLAGCLQGEPS